MATLTSGELVGLRNELRRNNQTATVNFNKIEINSTFQAGEDAFEAWRSTFGAAMQAGSTHTFSTAELKEIGATYLELKAQKERA